jgi:SAM-dependent methyltransferase
LMRVMATRPILVIADRADCRRSAPIAAIASDRGARAARGEGAMPNLRRLVKRWARRPSPPSYPAWVADDPSLIPPLNMMAWEGIEVLETWFRWGEEWSVELRAYAGLSRGSSVLEIGCGLGRIAFQLRYVLDGTGRYEGFDIMRPKVEFLQKTLQRAHPNFRFTWADVRNTHYNPGGTHAAAHYRFPYPDETFDVVFAASVFTHMVPENTANYFREASRVLGPGGRCLFSFFLLDHYRRGAKRPPWFDRPDFDFGHRYGDDDGCAIAVPGDTERMTAYGLAWIERAAASAGLSVAGPPLPGYWSGAPHWIGAQDLVVLTK